MWTGPKAIEKYKVVRSFEFVDEIVKYDQFK